MLLSKTGIYICFLFCLSNITRDVPIIIRRDDYRDLSLNALVLSTASSVRDVTYVIDYIQKCQVYYSVGAGKLQIQIVFNEAERKYQGTMDGACSQADGDEPLVGASTSKCKTDSLFYTSFTLRCLT